MPIKRSLDPDAEETVLYAVLLGIGAIPVVIALARHATFGFDATLGLLMAAVGVVGLAVQLVPRCRERARAAGSPRRPR